MHVVLAVLIGVALLPLAGCSSSGGSDGKTSYDYAIKEIAGLTVPADYPEKGYVSAAIVAGNTANQPIPSITPSLEPYLNSALLSGKDIKLFSAAGRNHHERISLQGTLIKVDAQGNERRNKFAMEGRQDVKENEENEENEENIGNIDIVNRSLNAPPKTGNLDFFGAMIEAAGALEQGSVEQNEESGTYQSKKLLIIIGSGLNDVGVLNFASNPALINQDPNEVAESILAMSGAGVIETTLSGFDVVFSGLGSTALPQGGLQYQGEENSRTNLRAIYQAIVERLGGRAIFDNPDLSETGSVETKLLVNPTVFDLSVPLQWSGDGDSDGDEQEWHFTEDSVRFQPDLYEYSDIEVARENLKVIADNIISDTQITILGYQAATSANIQRETSELTTARANAVRDVLINDLGVDPLQVIEVRGAGTGYFVDEFDENGNWDANLAPLNRVVVIKLSARG
jgi:outer membrane protein OmpA-like peptidoglycan-associated protein